MTSVMQKQLTMVIIVYAVGCGVLGVYLDPCSHGDSTATGGE